MWNAQIDNPISATLHQNGPRIPVSILCTF